MTTATATLDHLPSATRPRGLHLALWSAQIVLAGVFLMTGGMKLVAPIAQLRAQLPWVSGVMGDAVRFIGLVEVLGALGLVLPASTRILPRLTPLAAAGLTTVMVLAMATHLSRGEYPMIIANLLLGGAAAFVTWGRAVRAPIAPRA